MKIKFMYILTAVMLVLFTASCDTIQQASYQDTGVGGIVIDSSTKAPVVGAVINIQPSNITAISDSTGRYYIGHIPVPTSVGNYYLHASYPGYDSIMTGVILYAGDTTKIVNFVMFSGSDEVYTNYNIHVTEYVNYFSYSSLNLYDLFAIKDTITYMRDLRLRDSSLLRTNYRLITGWDYISGWGYQTKLTDLVGNYTLQEFDTLTSLFGGRPFVPGSDFPNDHTPYYSVPSTPSAVYGFYLLGRYLYGGGMTVYGLLRISDVYYDTNLGLNVMVVDLKVNRRGNNYFRLNRRN